MTILTEMRRRPARSGMMQGRPTSFEQRRCSDGDLDGGRRSGTFLTMRKNTVRRINSLPCWTFAANVDEPAFPQTYADGDEEAPLLDEDAWER
jgi:hypothetical protein